MKTNTAKNIISYISEKGWARPGELASHLEVTTQALHRHLRKLIENGVLVKKGEPPQTIYEMGPLKQAHINH
jgi:predicted transcriptional regulator